MKIDYVKVEELYKKGFSDYKIGKILGCNKSNIRRWRLKNNLKSNFKSSKEIHDSWSHEDFIKFYNQGLTDRVIGEKLGVSENSINSYRLKLKLKSNQSHDIPITKELEEVLVGTLLGDGYLNDISKSKIKKRKDTAFLVFAHCKKQKKYCYHKYNLLKPLFDNEPKERVQIRKGKEHIAYYAISKSSLSLKKYRNIFYNNDTNEKIIPKNIGNYFTPLSLALLYMDDGTLGRNSPNIALCNFSEESLNNLKDLLYSWNIKCTIDKYHNLYISAESRETFFSLIKPYIIPSMRYKIPESL